MAPGDNRAMAFARRKEHSNPEITLSKSYSALSSLCFPLYTYYFLRALKREILTHRVKCPRNYMVHSVFQDDYSRRRRLSTPSGSPSPPRPARLSQSTGTLTREEEPFRETKNTLTRENQPQGAESKGWFKSLSRKNKSNIKVRE